MSIVKPVNIIKHYGRAMEAELPDGKRVERQPGFFIEEMGFVYLDCEDYDEHFIWHRKWIPGDKSTEGPAYMCTCGSQAVFAFGKIVCYIHAMTGNHANLQSRWI